LREALANTGARIARPVKSEELCVTGLDESVAKEEVAAAIAAAGGCGDVRVGDIRRGPSGLGTAWMQCPTAAAKKVVATGRVTVGWVSARVEVLAPRPMRCYRCLKKEHIRSRCTTPIDRGDRCYRGTQRLAARGRSIVPCAVTWSGPRVTGWDRRSVPLKRGESTRLGE